MKKKLFTFLITGLMGITVFAQMPEVENFTTTKRTPEPFLFSVSTLTP